MRPPLLSSISLFALVCLLGAHAHAGRTLAVTPFENTGGKAADAALGKGLADMLITDLTQVSALTVVERDRIAAVLEELKLSQSSFVDPKTALKLGRGLAAELLMTGSYLLVDEKLRIDARVLEVATGRVVLSEKVEGTRAQFFAMEQELVEALVRSLKLQLGLAEKSALRKAQTESFEAWKSYSEGLDAKDKGDSKRAAELFKLALQEDPGYRAAKTAAGRVRALLKVSSAQQEEEFERERQKLDPKSADYGPQFQTLVWKIYVSNEPWAVRARCSVLTELVEKNLRPAIHYPGNPSNYPEHSLLFTMAAYFGADPEISDAIPAVYEYLVTKYPDSLMSSSVAQQLRFLEEFEARKKAEPAQVKQSFEASMEYWKKDPTQLGMVTERAAVHRLFRLIEKKMGD